MAAAISHDGDEGEAEIDGVLGRIRQVMIPVGGISWDERFEDGVGLGRAQVLERVRAIELSVLFYCVAGARHYAINLVRSNAAARMPAAGAGGMKVIIARAPILRRRRCGPFRGG